MTKPLLIILSGLLLAYLASACTIQGESFQSRGSTPELDTPVPGATKPTSQPQLQATPTLQPAVITTPLSTTATPAQTASPSPSPAPSPTQWTCWLKDGYFIHHNLISPDLKDPLEFRVFLPPCYEFDKSRRYPVLYLLHGQSFNDDQWERLGTGELASTLISTGEIPPFLIVMPRYQIWTGPPQNNFGQVIADELVPWIDSEYRTLPDRTSRAVGGLSKGAGWAVHLGLSHWDKFGSIGGHSLAVFWSDTIHIRQWLAEIPPENLPRIYLDIGDKDPPENMSSAVWFEDILTQANVPHEWYLLSGYHDEAYWSANLEHYLRWYTQEW
jgi:enterochelin esterase-like enzyme